MVEVLKLRTTLTSLSEGSSAPLEEPLEHWGVPECLPVPKFGTEAKHHHQNVHTDL